MTKTVKVPDAGYLVCTVYFVPVKDGESNVNCRTRAKALGASIEAVGEQHEAKMEQQSFSSCVRRAEAGALDQ
jgi:hypothetical protein